MSRNCSLVDFSLCLSISLSTTTFSLYLCYFIFYFITWQVDCFHPPWMALVMTTIDSICIVLFILGFIGNLLGLIVFSSRRFRCCSTYAILALTSFAINLVCIIRYTLLLHSTTRRWLSDNIVGTYWLTCKIFRLSSSFRVLAAWVTVFWVIERFIYVTSRLHVLLNRREQFQRWKKYKFLLMIVIALIMVVIVTAPTVFFFAPNLAK